MLARAWGVPLFMLYSDVQSGSSGKASRPDLSEQFINFIRSGYGTAALNFEAEFNKKLLNNSRAIRIKFDLDSLTLGTMGQRAELAKNMVDAGLWTPNEGREYTEREPIEGGDTLRSPRGGPSDNNGSEDNDEPDNDEPDNYIPKTENPQLYVNTI